MANAVFEAVRTVLAVREYEDKPIPGDVLLRIGEAGRLTERSASKSKRTLLAGLILIVLFSAAAGTSNSIGAIIGFRAGWGLGNALFIATALAVIVGAASGGITSAIVLYEAAIGIGIATGPILGGILGGITWRAPSSALPS